MDNSEWKQKWPELKKKIRKEYPHLSDDDLDEEPQNEAELLLLLQKILNKTDKEIHNWLSIMG